MEFFGREEEISELRKIREISYENSRFTLLTGRRRVGKTELARQALEDGTTPYLHLPITRQPEITLCAQLQEEVERVLKIGIHGQCQRFKDLFEEVVKESAKRPITLVLDEFQEFDRTNPGVFGDVQSVWDRYHKSAKLNLVVSGSVNRLINKIFYSDSEPLYGRNTGRLNLKPFKVSLLKKILAHYHQRYKADDLLALWVVSGGVARYVEMMISAKAYTRKAMLAQIFSLSSSYFDEGRAILAEEFGPDYGTYFTILASIAEGRTSSAELKSILGVEVGGYLAKLEDQYSLVSKKQPIFDTGHTKNCHYQIDDCFFRFWFRFIFKYRYLQELGRYSQMHDIAVRDFDVFSGYSLERYFHWKFVEEKSYSRMGAWWDRKGENEIDLVCEDETTNTLDIYEIKREADRIDLKELQRKSTRFFEKHPDLKSRSRHFHGLSLADM